MPRRSPRIVALLLLALSAVVRAQSGQATVVPPAGFPAAGQPPIVTLLAPGAEPRKALRITVASSLRSHMDMEMAMSMAMNMAGQEIPATAVPAIRVGADLNVTNVTPTGDVTYTMAFTGVGLANKEGVDPAVSAVIDSMGKDFASITGTAVVTNRGINRSVKIDTSKVTNSQFGQMMDSVTNSMNGVSSPLPEEPVGVGARWEVRQTLPSGGITMFQKIEYELTAFDGKSATVKMKIDQTGPPQSMSNPNLPPGATVRVESMTGGGTGTMTVPLDGLVPTSQVDSKTTMVMSIDAGGGPQRMTVETTVQMKIAIGK
jgi:hypothetical protein